MMLSQLRLMQGVRTTSYLVTVFQGLAWLLQFKEAHGQVEMCGQPQCFRFALVFLRQSGLVLQPGDDAFVLHRGLLVFGFLKNQNVREKMRSRKMSFSASVSDKDGFNSKGGNPQEAHN